MDEKTESTATEKLVVSRAIDIYGVDDEYNVTRYIAAMYSYIHPCRWRRIYQHVLEAHKEHGYTSPVDFCEDMRYEAARNMYMEKVALRNALLEGKDIEHPEPAEEYRWNIGEVKHALKMRSERAEETPDSRHMYTALDHKLIRQHVEAMSKQQRELKGFSTMAQPIREEQAPAGIKEKKRFYYKMSDEDRELDDFLDKIEEEEYGTPMRHVPEPNKLRAKYSAARPMEAESSPGTKKTEPLSPRTVGSMSLSDQYEYIVRKAASTKRQSKDKSMWQQELRILVRHFKDVVGRADEFDEIEAMISTSSISNTVLSVLMLLQDVINHSRDEVLIAECSNFKKSIASFNDYYRR
jgi:hypothetical protein